MDSPTFFGTLLKVAPLISYTAAFMGSIGHQFATGAWVHSSVPASVSTARHAVFPYWLDAWKVVVKISAPTHITTLTTCVLNMSDSHIHRGWWVAVMVFVAMHSHPLQLGLDWLALTPAKWSAKSEKEGQRWIKAFPDANARRLFFPDLFGWLTVLYAVITNLNAYMAS